MNKGRLKKERNPKFDRYLAKDVTGLEVTFRDGTKSNLKATFEDKVVVMKVYPNTLLEHPFVVSVLENYSNGINAAGLAVNCGYTCFRTFQRHFKSNFNDTVYNWMLKRKMEDIRSLVIGTDMSMAEITEMFNFKSPAHFTNAYKKHFGINPSEERNQVTE
ncbi:MAG: AraC family transcriptional regulator [Fermentimonas sp.]|nr:AraC family transcriptional regulator [Fermentimonas sp.]